MKSLHSVLQFALILGLTPLAFIPNAGAARKKNPPVVVEQIPAMDWTPMEDPLPPILLAPGSKAQQECFETDSDSTRNAFVQGAREGNGGISSLKGLFFEFDNLGGLRFRQTPETTACAGITVKAELDCCQKGYIQGLRSLRQKIEPDASTLDPAYAGCREQYAYARRIAERFCNPEGPHANTCEMPPTFTHPVCLHLGFVDEVAAQSKGLLKECRALQEFVPQAKAIANGLQRRSAPASWGNPAEHVDQALRKVGSEILDAADGIATRAENKKQSKKEKKK